MQNHFYKPGENIKKQLYENEGHQQMKFLPNILWNGKLSLSMDEWCLVSQDL